MPAYSFQERFVPFVKDGSKPHTIRARRRSFAKPGDTLYLYYGMRTKHCTKLREEVCSKAKTIFIKKNGAVIIYDDRLDDYQVDLLRNGKYPKMGMKLSDFNKDQLAWRDGFRPEGTSLKNPKGCFDLMIRFWNQTHKLPFIGDIIYWNPNATKAKNYDFNCRTNLETSYY
jgi:hypothetical protein